MCNPAAALAAVNVAKTVQGAMAQGALASRQQDIFEMTKVDAANRANDDIAQLRLRQQQERLSAAEELETMRRQVLEAAGTSKVSGVESGSTGASFSAVVDRFTKDELAFQFRAERTLKFREPFFKAQEKSRRTQQRNEVLAAAPTVSTPDFALVGLNIATDLILADVVAAKGEPGFLGFDFGADAIPTPDTSTLIGPGGYVFT